MRKMSGTWVLAAALVLGATASPASAQGSAPAGEEQGTAAVRIEIRQESGDTTEARTELDWGTDESVTFQGGGHTHDVALHLERSGKSKKVQAKVGYRRDGRPIIAPVDLTLQLGKRELLRIEGGLAIALTVTAKAGASGPPPSQRPPVKRPDGGTDDPLEGL